PPTTPLPSFPTRRSSDLAAGRGLHHHRIADVLRDLHRFVGRRDVAEIAGDDVDARLGGELLGLDLVAHRGDRLGRRADECDLLLDRKSTRLNSSHVAISY